MTPALSFGIAHRFARTMDLVVYSRRDQPSWVSGGTYAIARRVTDPEKNECEPWEPVTLEFVEQLARGLGSDLPREILPGHVLCRTHEVVAWWTPPQIRTLFFTHEDLAAIDGEDFPVPALLWRLELKDRSLFVRALKGDERPEGKTQLFVAPFLNVYPQGLVCQGSMRRPQAVSIDKLHEWETGFFGAAGSTQLTPKATTRPGQLPALWKSLKGKKSFPKRALAAVDQTAGEFLREVDR